MPKPTVETLREAVRKLGIAQSPQRPAIDPYDYLFYDDNGDADTALAEAVQQDQRERAIRNHREAPLLEEAERARRMEQLDLDAAWERERARVVGQRRREAREAEENGEFVIPFPDPPIERPPSWTPNGYRHVVATPAPPAPKPTRRERLIASREAVRRDTGIPQVVALRPAGDHDVWGRPLDHELVGVEVLEVPFGGDDSATTTVEHWRGPEMAFTSPDAPLTPNQIFAAAEAAKDDN